MRVIQELLSDADTHVEGTLLQSAMVLHPYPLPCRHGQILLRTSSSHTSLTTADASVSSARRGPRERTFWEELKYHLHQMKSLSDLDVQVSLLSLSLLGFTKLALMQMCTNN